MKVDRYLAHVAKVAGMTGPAGAAVESLRPGTADTAMRFPMLVQVDLASFDASQVSDFEVHCVIETVVAGTGTQASVATLQSDPSVISVEASRMSAIEDTAQSVPFARGDAVHRPPLSETGSSALVAVIDGGIDVLHECFLDGSGATRIEAVWDQTDGGGPSPAASGLGYPAGLNYGTLHTRAMIDGYINAGAVPPGLGRDLPPSGGHGTHVTSIAAGRAAGAFAGGMAPNARIVFVRPKLTVMPGDPLSLGYSVSHAVALTFIGHTGDILGLPVVVNVSQGMNAGAHDGSSLLEAAFDGFSEGGRRAGRVIVKSAGNERMHDGHARLDIATGLTRRLDWQSRVVHSGPDNIEVWYQAADDLRFRLHGPGGLPSNWVDWTTPAISGNFPAGVTYDIGLDRWFQDNGDSRLLVTVSAPLQIPIGRFGLEIYGQNVITAGLLDAWIERDNTRPILFTNHVQRERTLSIPGTARTVVAVASVEFNPAVSPSNFSSEGPARDERFKPDLSAPGHDIEAAQSGTASGVVVDSGTSMAAPHVSGAVALLLSRCQSSGLPVPNAMQIGSGLRNTAQNLRVSHSTSLGWGVLDTEAFVQAFW
jgi:subtilisin family serine protease